MYLFLLINIFYSISNSKEIFKAENIIKDHGFGARITLILSNDGQYNYSIIPEKENYSELHKVSGNYNILNDTIFFKNNLFFSKAIINNAYIELLETGYRIKIKKNQLKISSKNNQNEIKDFAVFTFTKSLQNDFDDSYLPTYCSHSELIKIKKIIIQQLEAKDKIFKNKKVTDYYKQCVFAINKKGETEVIIHGINKHSSLQKKYWKYKILNVSDGGNDYFEMKINLNTNLVYYFYPHSYG